MYTFSCSCGWRTDRRTAYGVAAVPCPCGAEAEREQVYSINFGGFASTPANERDLSRDFKSFTEASLEADYSHQRQEEAAGKPLPSLPLYQVARSRARQLLSQGATTDDLP